MNCGALLPVYRFYKAYSGAFFRRGGRPSLLPGWPALRLFAGRLENGFDHSQRRPRLGPACVKGQTGQSLGRFLRGDPIFRGLLDVMWQGTVQTAACRQRTDGDKTPVSRA